MPDLISLNKQVYNWAGIDLGEYNSLLLQKSLKELVKANGLTNLKLWGKITGIEKDYYIAETQTDAAGARRQWQWQLIGDISYLNASRIPPGRFERIERIERFDWIEKAEGLKG